MVTFDVSCAADGSYGFFIDQNAAAAPIVSRVLVPPTGPDGASSVLLPTGGKHLQDALHVGDLLVSINNAPLAHRPFTEVVSMFANATLPITLRVSRAAPTTTKSRAASGAGAGLLAATAGEEVVTLPATGEPESHVTAYLRNVASAIGIWSPIANVRDVPHVPVALLAVHISHVPALKKKLSCCKGTPSSADFYVQVFGGHGCKTLLYDSRAPTGGTALGRGGSAPSPAVVAGAGAGVNAAEERLLERVGSSAARASHRRLQSDSAALSWSIPPGVVMDSDYRVVVCVAGRKKPLFGVWAHTAGLPLPYAARAALPKRVQLAPEVAVNMSAAPSAGASAVAGAAATPVAPITAAGDADTPAVSSPTLASLHGVTLDSSAVEGATAAAASLSSVSVQPFVDDVTFGIVRPGMPSAGALFTALPSHAAADVATSPAAPVRMYDTRAARQVARSSCVFVKSQLDGASKDKKHKRFDATLQLRLDYTILGLPPVY
ncbi:PDZ domain-containing protein, partial [archaeon]